MKKNEKLSIDITAEQVPAFISLIEQEIAALSAKLQTDLMPFMEIESQYLELKKVVDNSQAAINQNKALLETLIRMKDRSTDNIRILRTTSHNADKNGKAKRIRWVKEFQIILQIEKRFMTFDELLAAFFKRYPNIIADKVNKSIIMANIKQGDLEQRNKIKQGLKVNNNAQQFFSYKNSWGLKAWFDDNFVPLPKYMSQFMYEHT